MKKTFRLLGAFALCTMMLPVFTSCGNDDDDDDAPEIPQIEGSRVTKVGDYILGYDSKGRLDYVSSSDESLTINYDKGTISFNDDEESYNDLKVKFTSKGYLAEVSSSWEGTEDGYKYKESGKASFSYDGDGHLTKGSSSYTTTYQEPGQGQSYSYSSKGSFKVTWESGNMTKFNETSQGDDGVWSYDVYIEYGATANRFYQVPVSLSEVALGGDIYSALAAAGLFGIGPKELPSNFEETSLDTDDDYNYEYSYSANYTLNDNGSIRTEKIDGKTYAWSYSDVDSRAASATAEKGNKHSIRNLFVKKPLKK